MPSPTFPIMKLPVVALRKTFTLMNIENLFFWNSEDLDIVYGDWLSIETFLSLNFATCEISKSNFSIEDWKVLISAWVNGWNPKMKHLLVRGKYDFSEITNNLGFGEMRDEEVVRNVYYKTSITDHGFEICGGYDVQRKSDGVLATIHVENGIDRVEFHVWD